MSVRIGVGPSLAFVRKQRGLRSLLSRRSNADRLYKELAPALDDPSLNVAGFHYFTFNQLVETWEWYCEHEGECERHSPEPVAPGVYVHREEGATS
jgi:methylenetetrahydrofolate reductase (NADPH)